MRHVLLLICSAVLIVACGSDEAAPAGSSAAAAGLPAPADIKLVPALVDDAGDGAETSPPRPRPIAAGTGDYLRGLDELEEARWDQALAALDKALNADEENPSYLLAHGVALLFSQKLKQAEAAFRRAGMLGAARDTANLWQATAVAMQGDFTRDSTIYLFATRDLFEYNLRAMSHDYGAASLGAGPPGVQTPRQDQRQEQEQALRQAGPELRRWLEAAMAAEEHAQQQERAVLAAHHQARREAALAQFPRLAREFAGRTKFSDPALAEVLLARGRQRLEQGEHARALRDLEAVAAQRPQDPQVMYLQALGLLHTGAPEGARRLLTRLLTRSPDEPALYQARALAQVRLGNLRQAEQDLQVLARLGGGEGGAARQELLQAPAPGTVNPVSMLQQLRQAAQEGAASEDLLRRAEAMVRAGNAGRVRSDERYQARLRELQQAVRAAPRDPDAWTELGRFRYEEAVNIFGEAVGPWAEFRPFRPQDDASRGEEVARAQRCFDRALELNERHVRALAFSAACRIYHRRWADAEVLLRRGLEIKADDAVVLDLFAQVLDHAAAVRAAKAADLRTTQTWSDLSYTYFRQPTQAEWDRAEELERQAERLWALAQQAIQSAIAAHQGRFEGHYVQGVLARRQRDPARAATAFEQAARLDPQHLRTLELLAGAQAAAGRIEASLLTQATAMNLTHTTAAPHLKLVWYHAQRTAWRSAGRALEAAQALDPSDPRGAAYAGALALHQDRADEALGWFAAAVALEEAQARLRGATLCGGEGPPLGAQEAGCMLAAQLQLAELCLARGRIDQALNAARAGAQLHPRFSEDALYQRCASAMMPGPFEAGAVPQAPNIVFLLAMLHVRWGQTLEVLGRHAEALPLYERVVRFETHKSPVRDLGAEVQVPLTLAKLGLVQALVAQQQWEQAHQAMMRLERPWGLPAEVEAQVRALDRQIEQGRRQQQEVQGLQERRAPERQFRSWHD